MPAKLTRRSATMPLQEAMDAQRGPLAFGDRVDDLLASICGVAAREVARVRRLHGLRIHAEPGALALELGDVRKQRLLRPLPGRADHRIDLEPELAARDGHGCAPAARVGGAQAHLDALERLHAAGAEHPHRCGLEQEATAVA